MKVGGMKVGGLRLGRLKSNRMTLDAALIDASWSRRAWQERRRTVIALGLAVVLMAVALSAVAGGPAGRRITAYFGAAVGVYPGSDVRILGVKVGTIDEVTPVGTQVRTRLTLDDGVPVPADAKAVVVAPSVVADRYIQLTPAYTGGMRIATGAVIPVTRTATPVELDQLYDSLKRISGDLGPKGANSKGALSRALQVGADNMAGNGKALNDTIAQMGQASRTLAGNSDDLFATLANLQKFTTMIKDNDLQVRQAERQLAEVTGFLAADRDELGAALRELAISLGQVRDFIRDNRALLKTDVDKLASLTQILVDQRHSLAEAFDILPLNATNLLNSYDPATRTLMGRGNLNEISMGPISGTSTGGAAGSALAALGQGTGSALCASSAASNTITKALCDKQRTGNMTPVPESATGILPPMPLPAVGDTYGSPGDPKQGGAEQGDRKQGGGR
ncbi:MCE family protein [Actinomadura sp. 9N407]|uniref:MCE family protein n=1 Tax=Actinomadura sp. 9N407 TaxID=3375154 RepID=UPI0037B961B0